MMMRIMQVLCNLHQSLATNPMTPLLQFYIRLPDIWGLEGAVRISEFFILGQLRHSVIKTNSKNYTQFMGESTLHPMYFPPKKKYKKVLILYFFWKKNLGFDF
jgi:hypothetical protein